MPRGLARLGAVTALVLAGSLLSACAEEPVAMPTPTPTPSATAAGDGVLRIGTLFPTSGDLEYLGDGQVAGVNAAVRQINDEGGVLGAKVEVVHRDSSDAGEKKLEKSFAELVDKGVDVIIGPSTSVLTLRILELA